MAGNNAYIATIQAAKRAGFQAGLESGRQQKERQVGEMKQSPCKTCKTAKLPINCDNKSCERWREWYLEKWAEFNKFYEKYGKESGGNDNCAAGECAAAHGAGYQGNAGNEH